MNYFGNHKQKVTVWQGIHTKVISWSTGAGNVVQWCPVSWPHGKVQILPKKHLFSTNIVRPCVRVSTNIFQPCRPGAKLFWDTLWHLKHRLWGWHGLHCASGFIFISKDSFEKSRNFIKSLLTSLNFLYPHMKKEPVEQCSLCR